MYAVVRTDSELKGYSGAKYAEELSSVVSIRLFMTSVVVYETFERWEMARRTELSLA